MTMKEHSRGKGGRRAPGRDGGKGRTVRAQWEKRAAHMLPSKDALKPVPVRVIFFGRLRDPSASIYLFDQEANKAGLQYYAELAGSAFEIWVPKTHEWSAWDIVAKIEGKRSVFEPARKG